MSRRKIGASLMGLLLAAYGLGMARGLSAPWTGLHDWNGAFYSQLARNFLRYPFEMHHGMPLVAVGDAAPVDERSIYATHPAGLVWLLAIGFQLFGESEAVARLTAIAASLISLAVWVRLVERARGRTVALLAGLIYSVLPMAVFYGRMVNHEAYCLCAMLCALMFWKWLVDRNRSTKRRIIAGAGWALAILLGMCIDWPVVLFAGLFCLHAAWACRKSRISGGLCATVWAVSLGSLLLVLAHIVYAGLGGSWADLYAIFTSRSSRSAEGLASGILHNTIENFTWPVLALAAVAILRLLPASAPRLNASSDRSPAMIGVDAWWVLHVTGVVWLVIFLRQYQQHQYWVFYLGPLISLYAAQGILDIRDIFERFGKRASHGACGVLLLFVLMFSLPGTDALYRRVQCPLEYVALWQFMRDAVPPDERVPLPWNPIREEQFGGYIFRNITPPQLAYYLDRPFEFRRPPDGSPVVPDAGR